MNEELDLTSIDVKEIETSLVNRTYKKLPEEVRGFIFMKF